MADNFILHICNIIVFTCQIRASLYYCNAVDSTIKENIPPNFKHVTTNTVTKEKTGMQNT